MSSQSFFELHNLIKNDTKKEDTNMRRSISTEERLAVTLRYLATGCTLTELHYSFRIGVSTLSSIIREMCKAIWTNLRITYMPEPKQEDWLKIADTFLNVTNFPNCIGAIDGKHIRIVKPAHSGSLYYNYKHFLK
ncbi:protein ANTAGONIST OF LIKE HETEROCHROMATIN PROTEIN 1-like [Myzus persicae]|uniref:protein ANTAGONIST OF LIKE HETEROCHROMATIN PROTEIN 1-like n=1 Tax=Myzus persicae TaxID=13164 RepID=UPI000B9301A8|nr:protein ANTAGONIST OF LIKE HETEROCHROMATIN PROTEIN 1-like [Myzus persicae]